MLLSQANLKEPEKRLIKKQPFDNLKCHEKEVILIDVNEIRIQASNLKLTSKRPHNM